jgi:hypothetical protein
MKATVIPKIYTRTLCTRRFLELLCKQSIGLSSAHLSECRIWEKRVLVLWRAPSTRRRRSECRRMKSSRYFEACSKHVPNSLLSVSAGLRT